jgi:uncharacterized protein YcbK (DUF882 family)
MISRRNFLALGAAATATTLISAKAHAAPNAHMERSIHLHNIHTGESVRTVYWHDGKYQPAALKQLNHILRDHYSGTTHTMDPHVIDVLSAIQHRLGPKPLHIVSGYRSPETNAMLASLTDGVAQHSLHMEGKAVDIRVDGLTVRKLGKLAKSLHAGGVGMYPSSNFVHVDVGRVRYW